MLQETVLADFGFATLTVTGLCVLQRPSLRSLSAAAGTLAIMHEAAQWGWADLVILCDELADGSQILDECGIPPRRLQNYAWVGRRFVRTLDQSVPARRRELPVTFSHHQAVAPLFANERCPEWAQVGVALLDRVVPERLSVDFLEARVRDLKGDRPAAGSQLDDALAHLKLARRDLSAAWHRLSGFPLARTVEMAMQYCDDAIKAIEAPPVLERGSVIAKESIPCLNNPESR